MPTLLGRVGLPALVALSASAAGLSAQMPAVTFADGWRLSAMAQAFPLYTLGVGGFGEGPYESGDAYLTQAAAMLRLTSPEGRWTLRVTPNFEAWTIGDGEVTPGAWGEGYLDRRHPHNLLHEAMLSWSHPELGLSLSAGKGFALYGTPDPMSRPGAKYPTNHHLSQILERWVVSAAWQGARWSLEAGVFGGTEPKDPYDFGNITSFGDSWSARFGYRFEEGVRATVSYGNVLEPPEPQNPIPGVPPEPQGSHPRGRGHLVNVSVGQDARIGAGRLEWMAEASRETHGGADYSFWALLGEARLDTGSSLPYLRVEYATRPEFARFGQPGSEDFYRYGFDDEAIGANRWLVATVGYAHRVRTGEFQFRPFVEGQGIRIEEDWGGFPPAELFGSDRGWVLNLGMKIYWGGDPMPMGSYGVLAPMMDGPAAGSHH